MQFDIEIKITATTPNDRVISEEYYPLKHISLEGVLSLLSMAEAVAGGKLVCKLKDNG
jgi:hypothetical protein